MTEQEKKLEWERAIFMCGVRIGCISRDLIYGYMAKFDFLNEDQAIQEICRDWNVSPETLNTVRHVLAEWILQLQNAVRAQIKSGGAIDN